MPTFFKHPAFGAIMLLATFCFLFEFHDAPKTMAFAIGVGAFVWALTGFAKEKEGPDRILAAIAKIDAYHADVSSYIGRCRNSGIESTASPVESQRDLLRKEHEQLLVRGAACAVAERPGSARDMAEGIKDFLCGLGHGAEDQAKEGDSLACKGINCGCTDGRSHSNECIVEAAMIQGWAGEKEARDAFAAIKSKTFASDATADGVATQPAAAPTQADQRIEAAKDGGQYAAQLAANALLVLNVSASTTPSAQADQRIEAELVAAGLTAPRVTADYIQALMDRVVYHYEQPQGTTSTFAHAFLDGFYLASGYSACVSAANFDAAKGQKYAKEQAEPKARDKLWALEGYALHSKLAAQR